MADRRWEEVAGRRCFRLSATVVFPCYQLALLLAAFHRSDAEEGTCFRRCLAVMSAASTVAVALLAEVSARLENYNLLGVCALTTVPPIVRSWRCGLHPGSSPADRLMFFTSATLEVVLFVSAVMLWRTFGWRQYRIVGGDVALNLAYLRYQRLQAALAADVTAFALLCLMSHLQVGLHWAIASALAGAAALLAGGGIHAVRVERKTVLSGVLVLRLGVTVALCFAVTMGAGNTGEGECTAPAWICSGSCPGTQDALLTTLVALFVTSGVALLLVFLASIQQTFGRGLRERVFSSDAIVRDQYLPTAQDLILDAHVADDEDPVVSGAGGSGTAPLAIPPVLAAASPAGAAPAESRPE